MKLQPSMKTIGVHAAFICAYFWYEAGMLYTLSNQKVYFWDSLWHLIINLSFFYLNALVALRLASGYPGQLKPFLFGALLIIIEFFLFLLVKYLLAMLYIRCGVKTTSPYPGFAIFLKITVWRFFYICGLSFGYWYARIAREKQVKVNDLEQQRLKDLVAQETAQRELVSVENAFLKSQINSHFLFNTLNYIHSSVHELSEKGAKAILGLSDILRYSLASPSNGKVLLSAEIEHISTLFNISKLKYNQQFFLEFKVEGDPDRLEIIPLVLITLAENVLKYAVVKDAASPALFSCKIEADRLHLLIDNQKKAAASPISYGIGLNNIIKRLDATYPERYELKIQQKENRYQLSLNIQLR